MQLRLTLAVIAVAACTMCGRTLASAAVRRKNTLDELSRALRTLNIQVSDMLELLPNALRMTGNALFSSVAERMDQAMSAADAWHAVRKEAVCRGGHADCLAQSDLEILDRMFEYLGNCGLEMQKNAIRSCAAALEDALTGAKARAGQVERLYGSIGFLAGLAMVVLMI